MYAIFSKVAQCSLNTITEDDRFDERFNEEYSLTEDTPEAREEAREDGFEFVHLFEEEDDDYDQTNYIYVTTQSL